MLIRLLNAAGDQDDVVQAFGAADQFSPNPYKTISLLEAAEAAS